MNPKEKQATSSAYCSVVFPQSLLHDLLQGSAKHNERGGLCKWQSWYPKHARRLVMESNPKAYWQDVICSTWQIFEASDNIHKALAWIVQHELTNSSKDPSSKEEVGFTGSKRNPCWSAPNLMQVTPLSVDPYNHCYPQRTHTKGY